MTIRQRVLIAFVLLLVPSVVLSANLEIYCLDVGQGDATLVISPTGKTLLFDSGDTGKGNNVVRPFLLSKGITSLDYVVCSHYHADHIGGLDETINGLGGSSKINIAAYDRAGSYTTQAYTDYVNAVGAKRTTFVKGQVLDLGGGATAKCVALNGNGVAGVSDENDLCVVLKISIGSFDFVAAGDLSGSNSGGYKDVETSIGPLVGDVEVYRVNHHGAAYSSNQSYVNALHPEVSVISVGTNSYGHPTQTVIDRLVAANSYIYRTEAGSGGTVPAGKGTVVGGNVVISTDGVLTYTVAGTTYTIPGAADVTPPVISAVSSGSVGVDVATVSWTTNETATSQVEYGTTVSYGQQSALDASLVLSHSVILSNLIPSTVYHYRVKSRDAALNLAVSGDYTFTTGSAPPDTYEPNDSFTSAYPVQNGTTFESYIYNGTDSDYYRFYVTGTGTVSASLTSLPKNYELRLYDPSRTNVARSTNAGTADESITYAARTTGTFYLRVYPATSSDYGKTDSYLLNVAYPNGVSAGGPSVIPSEDGVLMARTGPVAGKAEILFGLSSEKRVQLKIFDVKGREVSTVVDQTFSAGTHRAVWDGTGRSGTSVSSGVYFYRAVFGEKVVTGRMVFLR